MTWGIPTESEEKMKLKAEMADYLKGLNSIGVIDYKIYSEAFDFTMKLLDQMYKLGTKTQNCQSQSTVKELIKNNEPYK